MKSKKFTYTGNELDFFEKAYIWKKYYYSLRSKILHHLNYKLVNFLVFIKYIIERLKKN